MFGRHARNARLDLFFGPADEAATQPESGGSDGFLVVAAPDGEADNEVAAFLDRLQSALAVRIGTAHPICRSHKVPLHAHAGRGGVEWRCPSGDFACPVGQSLRRSWPPVADESPSFVNMVVSQRLGDHGVWRGVVSHNASVRADQWSVQVKLRHEADQDAIRAAVHPLVLQVETVGDDRWYG